MKYLYVLFMFLFTVQTNNNSVEYCDSQIKKGINALYKKDHSVSLEIFSGIKTISQQNNFYHQQFIATNCIGLNYYEMADYSEALDYYLEAYTIAMKHLTKDNEKTVLNNIALVYFKQGKYKESEKHQKHAYELAVENKDSIGIAIYAGNLANLYNQTNQPSKALEFINIAHSIAIILKEDRYVVDNDIIKAKIYLLRKDYNKTLGILRPLMQKLNDKEQNENKIEALLILSRLYQGKHQNEKALTYVQQAQKENLDYMHDKDIFNQLSSIYFSIGDYQKSLRYKDSVIVIKDSINAIKSQAMYQNSDIKMELQESEKALANEKRLKFYITSFCILVLALLGCLFRTLYLKNKQKRTIAERNEQITSLELKNKENENLLLEQQIKEKETETLLERERLKNELESKNRQLAANAIHIAQKNDKIEQYILRLKQNTEILKNDQLSQQLDQLKITLTKENSNDDFLTHFERTNNRFIDSLKEKHADLTPNDIRYICYVYMNLSTKEISSIFNITIEACRKRKREDF